MTFIALSDSEVKEIANSLTPVEISELRAVLADVLRQYSTGEDSEFQPHRAVVNRHGQVTLFMPATSARGICVKIVSSPADGKSPLKSVMTICDSSGKALGVMAAEEFTAFRTSLGSMLLFPFRREVQNLVVFGAGKQAKWHVKLALLLRGKDVKTISVVNRSRDRAEDMIADVSTALPQLTSTVKLEHVDPQNEHRVRDVLAEANAIFCATPSATPLFPREYITSAAARKRAKYITAIGSYRLDMQELDPDLLRHVVDESNASTSEAKTIVVDSREACFQESGEIVNAKLTGAQLSEVGETLEQMRSDVATPGLGEWLAEGLVVYKSVGIGVMDMSLGHRFLEFAEERGKGVSMGDLS